MNVPADFGNQDVVWTLRIDDQDYSVPGHITHFDYNIQEPDHRSLNSVAPLVRFLEPEGPEGRGRGGVWAGPMRTEVRNPLSLRIEVVEPEITSPYSAFEMVTARWAKHQDRERWSFSTWTMQRPCREEPVDYDRDVQRAWELRSGRAGLRR